MEERNAASARAYVPYAIIGQSFDGAICVALSIRMIRHSPGYRVPEAMTTINLVECSAFAPIAASRPSLRMHNARIGAARRESMCTKRKCVSFVSTVRWVRTKRNRTGTGKTNQL